MKSLTDLARWLGSAPDGTTVSAAAMHREISSLLADAPEAETIRPASAPIEQSWRERLWSCPPSTRLTLPDLAEAIGKSTSWVYKRTGPKATGERIPCRRLAGELVFVASEVRGWIEETEEVVNAGPRHLRAS